MKAAILLLSLSVVVNPAARANDGPPVAMIPTEFLGKWAIPGTNCKYWYDSAVAFEVKPKLIQFSEWQDKALSVKLISKGSVAVRFRNDGDDDSDKVTYGTITLRLNNGQLHIFNEKQNYIRCK